MHWSNAVACFELELDVSAAAYRVCRREAASGEGAGDCPLTSGLFRLSVISGRARSSTLPLVEQAPLDRRHWQAASPEGGRRREPAPSPGAGTLRGHQAEAGDRPGGFGSRTAGRCCVCESPESQRTGEGALEWPRVNLKGPVQSESGRTPVPIEQRSTAQQL